MSEAVGEQGKRLPETIRRALTGAKGRLRARVLKVGAAAVVLVLFAYIHGTFLLDRGLDLPMEFRGVLLALGVLAVALAGWRFLASPLSHTPSDDEAALLLERAYPDLRDLLVSAVQLSRGGSAAVHSGALVDAVVAEAQERAKTLDPGRITLGRDERRAGIVAVLGFLLTVAIFAVRDRDVSIWVDRCLLLRDTPWPREVELQVLLDERSDEVVKERIVAKGDDVVIRAKVLRGKPTRLVMRPEFETQGRGDDLPMVEARGEWRAAIENAPESFRLYVEGGDYRSQWFRVTVRPRPRVEALSVWLEHPAYTALAATPEAEPLGDMNLKVPQGTLVRWRAKASAPLSAGELSFATPAAVTEVAQPQAPSARELAGSFRVKDSTGVTFRLVSSEGFETPVAAQYAIRAIPDRLPDVRVPKPGRNKDVSRAAKIAIKVEAKDDYRLEAASLVHVVVPAKRREGSAPEERRAALPGLPGEGGLKSITIDHIFDLATLTPPPEVGDRITWWVEAVDNRAPRPDTQSVPPESRGKSERYQLHVVADDEVERQAQAALRRVRDDLTGLAKAERASVGDLTQLAQELPTRSQPDARDRRRLTYAELDQRKVAQRLDAVRSSLGEIKDEMRQNGAAKEEDIRWVGDLEAGADRVAKEPVARATQALSELRQQEKPDATKLLAAVRDQAEAAESLEELVRGLEKWDEFNEILRDFRELLSTQERIQQDTQDRAKQDLQRR